MTSAWKSATDIAAKAMRSVAPSLVSISRR
jgi:hypothetical protein